MSVDRMKNIGNRCVCFINEQREFAKKESCTLSPAHTFPKLKKIVFASHWNWKKETRQRENKSGQENWANFRQLFILRPSTRVSTKFNTKIKTKHHVFCERVLREYIKWPRCEANRTFEIVADEWKSLKLKKNVCVCDVMGALRKYLPSLSLFRSVWVEFPLTFSTSFIWNVVKIWYIFGFFLPAHRVDPTMYRIFTK